VHYTLPTYGALAWLMAAALTGPLALRLTRATRIAGAVCSLLGASLFAVIAVAGLRLYGDPSDGFAAVLTIVLYLAAGLAGAVLLLRGQAMRGAAAAVVLGVLAHGVLAGGLLPRLEPIWMSRETARLMEEAMLDPKGGLTSGPVEVAGYAEPSLVFALGTRTGLEDAEAAATALAQGRPAIVERSEEKAFLAALTTRNIAFRRVGAVSGVNYSNGDETTLTVYGPVRPPAGPTPAVPEPATAAAAPAP